MPEDVKSRILKAAFEEFAAKGKAGARMQSIADRAEINKAMLNYYFTSKNQLYMEVIRETLIEFDREISQNLVKIDDAKQFFRMYISEYSRVLDENPDWLSLLVHRILEGDKEIMEIFNSTDFTLQLRRRIDDFTKSGQLRTSDSKQIFIHLKSLTVGAFLFKEIFNRFYPSPAGKSYSAERMKAVIDLLEHGIYSDKFKEEKLEK